MRIFLQRVFDSGQTALCRVSRLSLLSLVMATMLSSLLAHADDANFLVQDIRIEGLQRVSAGAVFRALPIRVRQEANAQLIQEAILALYATENFNHIEIARDENVLVILIEERPSINEINLEGNRAIPEEALLDGLKDAGLSEGKIFKRSTLEGIRNELQRQYVGQGRYDADIVTEVEILPRNRVAINIDVDEGSVAKIRHINIVGAHAFPKQELLELFELHKTGSWSWIRGDDKYSREKLRGDIETLESHYRNRGYAKFNIDSTQVSVSPERDSVYITLNVTEGDIYQIDKVELAGDIIISEAEMRLYLLTRKGQTFSQQRITSTEELVTKRLGNDGYMYAEVNSAQAIHDETKTVDIKYYVVPGNRTYVNRIEFRGNTKSVDEVLRREMRQMEAAPAANHRIEQSRLRLERLGFFKEVKVDSYLVPGYDDLVDVQFSVEEQHSGSIGASIGYSDGSGMILGASLQQNNFMGTGKQIGFSINSSKYQDNYRISYMNPYYTEDGVSRGFSVFYRKTNPAEVGISRYNTDTYGASVTFGYPINEAERLSFSFTASHTEVTTGPYAVQEIRTSPVPNAAVDYYVDVNPNFDPSNPVGLPFASYIDVDINGDGKIGLNEAEALVNNPLYYDAANQKWLPSLMLLDANGNETGLLNGAALYEADGSTLKPEFVGLDADGNGFIDFGDDVSRNGRVEQGAQALLITDLASDPFVDSPEGFLDRYGDTFNDYTVTATWIENRLNRGMFATAGYKQSLSLEVSVPGSDLEFFKANYRGERYFPLGRGYSVRFHTELGYGDGFGELDELPFFENFYAGGFGSVRGFDNNALGPRSTFADFYNTSQGFYLDPNDPNNAADPNGPPVPFLQQAYVRQNGQFVAGPFEGGDPSPFGGNVLIQGGIELVVPLPFVKDQRSIRTVAFIDAGNVFDTSCGATQINCSKVDFGELRYSAGIGLTWITAMGPLTFSLAKPFQYNEYDERKTFQFTLGAGF